jgi:hypothetical protein
MRVMRSRPMYFVGEPEVRRPLGISRSILGDNIKIDLRETV